MQGIALEASGRFGTAFLEALEHNKMNVRDLAAAIDGSYEHLRKLLKGLAYPSGYLLKDICKVLKLDFNEMENLVTQDKLEAKFGSSLHAVMGTDPNLSPFAELIPHLTQEQRESFLAQMKAVMRQNRRARA